MIPARRRSRLCYADVSLLPGFKSIPDIADSSDIHRRLRIPFNLVPQSIDAAIDAARSYKDIVSPDMLEDFVAS